MASTLPLRLLHLARIDHAVAYTLLNRTWMLGSNALTMLFIVHFFSGTQQGLYFTFLTLLGLHVVFDLGVSFTVTQWTARIRARLEEAPGVATTARIADGPAKDSLAHLARSAARQVSVLASLFLVSALCLGVWLFANDPRAARGQWLVPWVLATIFTSLRILLLSLEGLLEGLGKVSYVAQVRLSGLVAGTLALWIIVSAGGGLWGLVASCALTFLVPAVAYGRRYGGLLRELLATKASDAGAFDWRRDVWPFQWKYAATVLTGFLIANLFNPAVYYYRGAEAAGRFGLAMSIAQAVAGFMSVWLNCKVPQISLLTAERRYRELQTLFRSIKQSTAVVALLAGSAAMALIGLLSVADPALGTRIPTATTLLVLMAAAVLQQSILTVAVFARAHTREPLLVPSLLVACVTPILLALLVPRHGALGAAASYLLPVLLVALPFAYAVNRQLTATLAGAAPVAHAMRSIPERRRRLRPFLHSLRGVYALRYWRGQMELVRIMAHPGFAGLMRRSPRVIVKYLHRNYLAVGLDTPCRLAILSCHYTFLGRAFNAQWLRTLYRDGLPVWRRSGVSITLEFPRHDFEGELSFVLRVGDVQIYSLTATVADGRALGFGAVPVLLITCLQGGAGQLQLIRKATRACANTQPPYLLLAAVAGLVAALGIDRIVAVGNARQLAMPGGQVRFDYDRFWSLLSSVPAHGGFYQFPAQLPEKALQAVPSRHRSREVRKRDLKRGVAESVACCLRQGMAAPPALDC